MVVRYVIILGRVAHVERGTFLAGGGGGGVNHRFQFLGEARLSI